MTLSSGHTEVGAVVNKRQAYRQILRDSMRDGMQLEDVLLRALVLHTHSIALRPGIDLDDVERNPGESRLILAPLTTTYVASLLASLWPESSEWGREGFWFSKYGTITPYQLFEELPDELRDLALAARTSIEEHRLVDQLIEE